MLLLKGNALNVFCILLLIVCPLLFPKIGEQQYSYVQGLCFLLLAWLGLVFQIQKHKQAIVVRSMDVAMGVCLLALLLHIFWIRPVSLSVWRWVDAVGLFAFYGFVRLSSPKEIKVLVACVMVGGWLQCFYAGMQGTGLLPSLHSAFPMTGSFLNPAPLAGYLAVLVCMLGTVLFLDNRLKGRTRKFAWGSLLLFFLFVLLLNSRAALFATIVIMAVVGYSRMKFKRKKLYAGILIVGLGLSLYGLYQVREVSANGRLFIWKNTCEMIRDHPLIGVGIDRFKAEFPTYQAQYHSRLTEEVEKYYDGNTFLVFNEYLRAVAETGFLLPLLFLFPIGVVYSCRNRSPGCRAAVSGIACILVFSCFSYPFSVFTLEVLTVLLVAVIGRWSRPMVRWKLPWGINYLVTGIAVGCVCMTLNGMMAVCEWYDHQHASCPSSTSFDYEKHAVWFNEDISFIRSRCREAEMKGDTVQALTVLNEAISRVPVAGFYLQRADLYMATGEHLSAEQEYRFLCHLSPTNMEPVFKLALLYQQTGKGKEALELLEPYQKISPRGKTLEQKAMLLKMRELFLAISQNVSL